MATLSAAPFAGSLSSPGFQIYEPESSQTRIGNNLTGDALVTLLPDELFVDTVKRLGVEPFKERVYAAR